MEHRHLLPEEIDLLLDGEVGFGVQPLRAHVRGCDLCRRELEDARALVRELETLPHLAPSPRFAESVMARVQVIEPVHVAAVQTARRWMPQSRPLRVVAGAAAVAVASVLSMVSLWVFGNLESLAFFGSLVLDRTRDGILASLGSALAGAFGPGAVDALRASGPAGLAITAIALLLAIAAAAFGLRAVATASRRRG